MSKEAREGVGLRAARIAHFDERALARWERIEEGHEVMEEFKGKPALGAGLLAAAKRLSIMRSPATNSEDLG